MRLFSPKHEAKQNRLRYAQANMLYVAYAQWCDDNNEYKMSNTKFGIELAKRFPKTSSRKGNTNAKFYIGISLDG